MYCGQARKMPQELKYLLTSEMTRAIDEANLGALDTVIAKRYYVDRVAQIDIAEELGYERSAISKRLKNINPRIYNSISRIPPS